MTQKIEPAALWSRALVVGSMAVFLGVWGHTSAEGRLPGAAAMVALVTGSILLTVPFMARRASPTKLVALLVGGQTLIHLFLTVTAGHRGDPVTGVTTVTKATQPGAPQPEGLSSLPTVDGRRVGSLQDAYQGTSDLAPTTPTLPVGHLIGDLQAHAPMMVAHLVAAALIGLWLAYGERLLWTLVALAAHAVLALVRVVVPVTLPVRVAHADDVERASVGPHLLVLARVHARRGPPSARTDFALAC